MKAKASNLRKKTYRKKIKINDDFKKGVAVGVGITIGAILYALLKEK